MTLQSGHRSRALEITPSFSMAAREQVLQVQKVREMKERVGLRCLCVGNCMTDRMYHDPEERPYKVALNRSLYRLNPTAPKNVRHISATAISISQLRIHRVITFARSL